MCKCAWHDKRGWAPADGNSLWVQWHPPDDIGQFPPLRSKTLSMFQQRRCYWLTLKITNFWSWDAWYSSMSHLLKRCYTLGKKIKKIKPSSVQTKERVVCICKSTLCSETVCIIWDQHFKPQNSIRRSCLVMEWLSFV